MEKDNIDNAERLYRAGDYLSARDLAEKIAAHEQAGEAEKERARRILTATGTDPMVAVAFLTTAGIIVFLIIWYIL